MYPQTNTNFISIDNIDMCTEATIIITLYLPYLNQTEFSNTIKELLANFNDKIFKIDAKFNENIAKQDSKLMEMLRIGSRPCHFRSKKENKFTKTRFPRQENIFFQKILR